MYRRVDGSPESSRTRAWPCQNSTPAPTLMGTGPTTPGWGWGPATEGAVHNADRAEWGAVLALGLSSRSPLNKSPYVPSCPLCSLGKCPRAPKAKVGDPGL